MIDPRTLEAIRNPMAGLSNIGAMYAKGVEMKGRREDREMRRDAMVLAEDRASRAETMAQDKWTEQKRVNLLNKQLTEAQIGKAEMDSMHDQSRVMGALTTQVMEDIKANPQLAQNQEVYNQYLETVTQDLPDSISQQIKATPLNQLERVNRRSNRMAKALDDRVVKPTYETISVQNKKTGAIDTYRKDDPRIDKLIGGGTHIKYFPSAKGTTGDAPDLQKKTRGKLEDRALFAADLQDSVASVQKLFAGGGSEKLTVWDRMYDAAAEGVEKLGVPLGDKAKDSVKLRQQMIGHTVQVQSNWRRAITGTQASKFELNDIKKQIFQMSDSETIYKTKLDSWKDTSDKMAVRVKKALSDGFKHTGTMKKENGDEIPIYTNEAGENRSLSSFGSLSEIPTMKEYMATSLQNKYPEDVFSSMSKVDKQKAIREVTQQANLLGYR